MPYEEIRHTADWSIRVWSNDLPGLFVEAALGMYERAGIAFEDSSSIERVFTARAHDPESLLVQFLGELIFIAETEHLAFRKFDITIEHDQMRAAMSGAPIRTIQKSIKAVTYHNLKIHSTNEGVEVELVFDV